MKWAAYRNTLQPTALAGPYLAKEALQTDLVAVWAVSNRRSAGLAPLLDHLLGADAVSGDQSVQVAARVGSMCLCLLNENSLN